jgi:hypothetical protein
MVVHHRLCGRPLCDVEVDGSHRLNVVYAPNRKRALRQDVYLTNVEGGTTTRFRCRCGADVTIRDLAGLLQRDDHGEVEVRRVAARP